MGEALLKTTGGTRKGTCWGSGGPSQHPRSPTSSWTSHANAEPRLPDSEEGGYPAWYLFLPTSALVSLTVIITLQSWKDT